MHRFFIPKENLDIGTGKAKITDKNDIKHASKALRVEIGEKIELCDNEGVEHICEVIAIESDFIECDVQESVMNTRESGIHITLFQGLPKADKLEMIIQKTTELGVVSVIPVQMKRSVAKWKDDKSSSKKLERWNKIAFEAAKQSKRGRIPSVDKPLTVKQLKDVISEYDLMVLPYENESAQGIGQVVKDAQAQGEDIKRVGIIIGPEGGFAEEEVELLSEAGAKSVKLGPRILRTETAGVVTVALLQFALGDLGGL
tara:strand:- start:248 stop:1018 length:771 start_codon:yes stop_codon:yes gene_type:complete